MLKVKYLLVFLLLALAIFTYRFFNHTDDVSLNLDNNFSTKIELNQSTLKEFNLFGQEQKTIIGNKVQIDNNDNVILDNSFIYLTNNQTNLLNYYYLNSNSAMVSDNLINLHNQAILFSLNANNLFTLINMYNAKLDLKSSLLSSTGPVNILLKQGRLLAGSFSLDLSTHKLQLNNNSASFLHFNVSNDNQ